MGILFTNTLKFGPHCHQVQMKANQRCYLIRKCFPNSDSCALHKAFIIYVRPLLEYASEVWNPYQVQDILSIESVQRSYTKRIPGLWSLTYEDRLLKLGLDTLEMRRAKIDLKTCYKILNDFTYYCPNDPIIKIKTSVKTRTSGSKLFWPTASKNVRHHFFQARVGRAWNALPLSTQQSPTLSLFSAKLNTMT